MNLTCKLAATAAAIAVVVTLTGCTNSAAEKDQKSSTDQLDIYQKNQPVPMSDWSQYRQTVLDVEGAQIHGVATTTFFFNEGTDKPIKVCPSLGFPVPSTAQLTNPDQIAFSNGSDSQVIAQQEPNGVFTGDSTGTYIVCVSPSGKNYVSYWEGNVHTEGGPAHWDSEQGLIVADGTPTVIATTK